MSKLNIYRASAGSGKTYTLTGEYLKLLFKDPLNYRSILAVTFTNKATDEMKSRILREINHLAKGEPSGYESLLMEEYGMNSSELKRRAQEILSRLLHDYSRFSVTTIDSFFQKVVRSFTREVGMQMGFSIELDQARVMSEVIDNLLLDIDDDDDLRGWLVRFAESKIQEGKSWNLKRDILELGEEIFKEDFKSFNKVLIKKLSDKKFLTEYRAALQGVKEEFETHLQQIGEKARNIIDEQGLSITDFVYGVSGVGGYLYKLGAGGGLEPKIRVRAAVDNPDKWTPKKAPVAVKMAVETAFYQGLNELAREAVRFYDEQFMLYNSTGKTLNYIYTLGILTDISRKVQQYTNDENIFLLSDASRLLKDIIGNNDTPFIYEKIGNIYKHIMIDEFQDTSRMQWDNFMPLVSNSLAQHNHSLVVGDVKQSIYRWRNGDWKLLSQQLEMDFKNKGINSMTLDNNWRSYQNVIDFNNAFYSIASHILQNHYNSSIPEVLRETLTDEQQKISGAYRDVCQCFPGDDKKKGGYVCSRFIDQEKGEVWKEQVMEELPGLIEKLQDNGFRARDIAILVRKASEGRMVADMLMSYKNGSNALPQYNYDLISNDSLLVKNSPVVSFLIHLLAYFVTPDDLINRAFLIQEYSRYICGEEPRDMDELCSMNGEYEDDFKSLLPDRFISRIEVLKRLPLYDLVEELLEIFELNMNPEEYPYLQAFQDLVLSFSNGETPDLSSFMVWWNERKDKEVISVSEEQDAIRIMTIHKSKGLEFKAVIIPFCCWDLDNNPLHSNILWCQPKVPGFNQLDVIPVRYDGGLKNTIYYKEYYQEQMHAFVDNLNLLYVATTRAEKVLYTYSPAPSGKKELKNVADIIFSVYSNALNFSSQNEKFSLIQLSDGWDQENKCFEWGTLSHNAQEIKKSEKIKLNYYPVHLLDERLKLKCHSGEYFNFSATESVDEIAPVNRGNILHELFQLIRYREDLDSAICQLKFQGKLDDKQSLDVHRFALNIMDIEEVKGWFSQEWKVINERDILMGKEQVVRPDRVMVKGDKAVVVDYKFGHKRSDSYNRQVKNYMSILLEMGYSNVDGYILYGKTRDVERVYL